MLFPLRNWPGSAPRVVVTGAGVVTALGLGWRANADALRAGRTAFRPVTLFDVSRHRVKTAAQADLPDILPPTRLSARQEARLDRAARMLLLAGVEAWRQSGWTPAPDLPLVLGTSAGGMSVGEDYFRHTLETTPPKRRQPTRALHYQAQTQARALAAALALEGPITLVANACASGASALSQACELLRAGAAERVLAGGYDALSLMVFSGFDSLQALSPTLCRPFDQARDGLTLGEGAAVLTLETLEHARRRGADILGEIPGCGGALDGHHLTQPHPEGAAALAAMNEACAEARITPADVDYVNAHGTGTPLNDSAEAAALNRWAGPRAATLPVSSTKAAMGHLLGGAGAVEAVVSLMTLREGFLPPEIHLGATDPACAFPVVRQPADADIRTVLSNSFGFGGSNATLIFRRCP